jgi:hypothetical protein
MVSTVFALAGSLRPCIGGFYNRQTFAAQGFFGNSRLIGPVTTPANARLVAGVRAFGLGIGLLPCFGGVAACGDAGLAVAKIRPAAKPTDCARKRATVADSGLVRAGHGVSIR